MKKSLLLSILAFFLLNVTAFSQDIIHMRTGEVLEVYVTKIGVDEISYTLTKESRLEISVDKTQVSEIILEDGTRYTFDLDGLSLAPIDYNSQKRQALKVGIFSPLWGYFRVEYERNLKPGHSLLITANVIGLGMNFNDENQSGFGASVGYKFMTNPTYYQSRQKRAHRMMGSYLMVEAATNIFSKEMYMYNTVDYTTSKALVSMFTGALIFSYGKQFVFGNIAVLDYSVGAGYGFRNTYYITRNDKSDFYYDEFLPLTNYGFLGGDSDFPLVIKTRVSIGLLL